MPPPLLGDFADRVAETPLELDVWLEVGRVLHRDGGVMEVAEPHAGQLSMEEEKRLDGRRQGGQAVGREEAGHEAAGGFAEPGAHGNPHGFALEDAGLPPEDEGLEGHEKQVVEFCGGQAARHGQLKLGLHGPHVCHERADRASQFLLKFFPYVALNRAAFRNQSSVSSASGLGRSGLGRGANVALTMMRYPSMSSSGASGLVSQAVSRASRITHMTVLAAP